MISRFPFSHRLFSKSSIKINVWLAYHFYSNNNSKFTIKSCHAWVFHPHNTRTRSQHMCTPPEACTHTHTRPHTHGHTHTHIHASQSSSIYFPFTQSKCMWTQEHRLIGRRRGDQKLKYLFPKEQSVETNYSLDSSINSWISTWILLNWWRNLEENLKKIWREWGEKFRNFWEKWGAGFVC